MGRSATTRVAVVGGGPAGLTAALLLARLGTETTLVAPLQAGIDRRTAALFGGSIALLQNLGVWAGLEPHCAPVLGIRLIDGQDHLLRAPETLFTAGEQGLDVFGYNVPNAKLVEILQDAAHREASLTIVSASAHSLGAEDGRAVLRLSNGDDLRADGVVAADGRKSVCREAAGIAVRAWDYPQSALVTTFAHQRPHRGISTEFHRANGPLTTVPMPGHRSSLVWVDSHAEAERLRQLHDDAFRDELEGRLSGLLGTIEDLSPRAAFPLSGVSAETMGQGVVALVGEAAHVMPPIGAQGLNLGLRDAASVAECIAEAGTDTIALQDAVARYARERRLDVASRVAAIDALNRSLLTGFLPAHLMRGFGMFALGASSALRRIVVREGLQPSISLPRFMTPGGLSVRAPAS